MSFLRVLVFLLLVLSGVAGGAGVQYRAAIAAVAAEPTLETVAAAEDASTQVRTFTEAYNLLLDHYIQPLNSSAMLQAAWDQLAKDSANKAAPPGPSPTFSGDRAADLETMRAAL